MCLATALHSAGADQEKLVDTALNLLWVEQHDLESPDIFARLLELSKLTSIDEEKARSDLTNNSIQAFESGVFGVPTFKLGEEVFFGADRMEMIANRLGISKR